MAETVFVLTEAKLQNMVTAIMRQVNVRISDYIDQNAISANSRTDKIASPKAVYDALKTVESVVPIVNSKKLAVDFSLIPTPSNKVIYVILETADSTDGIPYIFIPDPEEPGEGTFVRISQPVSEHSDYEHKEFTDAQINNIVAAAVSATAPTFE